MKYTKLKWLRESENGDNEMDGNVSDHLYV